MGASKGDSFTALPTGLNLGTITEQGAYEDLLRADGPFADMMRRFASVDRSGDHPSPRGSTAKPVKKKEQEEEAEEEEEVVKGGQEGDGVEEVAAGEKRGKLMTVEERAVGSVDRSVWCDAAVALCICCRRG